MSCGGLLGRLVLIGRLPGLPDALSLESLSLVEPLASVGVNSGPVSMLKKRDERRASKVSISKCGFVRYLTESTKEPIGCGICANVCVVVESAGDKGARGVPVHYEGNP